MKYRPEIDSLRAIAVAAVILNHAGIKLFKGGFIGVDIFFVISGFLITSIILRDINNKCFSLALFYEKRARRIFPALFFAITISIPAAYFILLPDDLLEFANSVASVSTFSSNIFFWSQTGYFDTAAEFKPLLHTWSLAIEEQFYLLFPLILLVLWPRSHKFTKATLIIALIASLSISEWSSQIWPSTSFYMLHTRGWELLIGALVAIYYKPEKAHSKPLQEALSLLGLGLITYSIFFWNKFAPHPGLATLSPTIGTALVLAYTTTGTVSHKLLTFKPIQHIGVISYSLYLLHQPLFAFSRELYGLEHTERHAIILCVTLVLLAHLSWRFIEQPFRNREKISRITIYILSAICLTIFFAFFIFIRIQSTPPPLTPQNIKAIESIKIANARLLEQMKGFKSYTHRLKDSVHLKPFLQKDAIKVLSIGDSMSGDMLNIFSELQSDHHFEFSSVHRQANTGNLYVNSSLFKHQPKGEYDDLFSEAVESLIRHADIVIIASSWRSWELELLPLSIKNLKEKFGNKFLVVCPKIIFFPERRIYTRPPEQRGSIKAIVTNEAKKFTNMINQSVDTHIFDCLSLLKDKSGKVPVFDNDGNLIYFDNYHITPAGARYIASKFPLELIDTILDQSKTSTNHAASDRKVLDD